MGIEDTYVHLRAVCEEAGVAVVGGSESLCALPRKGIPGQPSPKLSSASWRRGWGVWAEASWGSWLSGWGAGPSWDPGTAQGMRAGGSCHRRGVEHSRW